MKTLMEPGIGLFLCMGTGLGIGLFGRPGWGWQGFGGAIIIAVANIVLRSSHYQDYVAGCEGRETKPSVIWYLVLCLLENSVIIFVVAFAIFFLKGFLQH